MSAKSANKDVNVKIPRGKQRKRFLEQNDALSLATSIAEEQEAKASTKSERHHKSEDDSRPKPDRKQISGSKAKLKETKVALKAKQLDAKRERVKSRKNRLKGGSHGGNQLEQAPVISEAKVRKTVSFA